MKNERIEYKNQNFTFVECYTETPMPNTEDEIHAHHDGAEIYEFIKGELYFAADGERIDIADGDIVIITDGVLHRPIIKKESPYHRRRIPVKNSFFIRAAREAAALKQRLDDKRVIKLDKSSAAHTECAALILRIKRLLSVGDDYSVFCAETALTSLFIRALEECGTAPTIACRAVNADVKSIVSYIDDNIASRLDYKTLASLVHLSEKNLYKLFKKETGFTLSKYVRERRIIIAKSHLNSGASPKHAAEAAGFSDYSTFYRAFTSSVGMTPTEYAAADK